MTAFPPLKIDAPWLREPPRARIFAALAARGFVARAVGGAVRDAILGLPVEDVDMATPASPPDVMAAAQAAGLKALPTGIAHGTVTILVDGVSTEVTTLRRDVETHGRHATVAFTDDWVADAARRDFTMNALYCDADGTVHDPLHGYEDVLSGRVRFIGDAGQRIREDYLRILRFFRFNARYATGAPDASGLAACVREREGLARLSGERVSQELRRLLVAPRAQAMMRVLFEYGLVTLVLGCAPRIARLARMMAIEEALGARRDVVLRLAALAVEVAEDVRHLQARLKLTNAETGRLMRLTTIPVVAGPPSEREARAWLYAAGSQGFRDRVLALWARCVDADAQDGRWRALADLPQRWTAPKFPLTGADAAAVGIAPGPTMGDALRAAERAWVDSDFALDDGALRARLAEFAAPA